ncbi:fluoride efflux transporter CrcB [Micromonospora sp. NBC_01796]|uniref:fluoride efflux transporter CrcB n=1 Tax=Micromonospora sp. NBC_01796 TaxID=2975987 RepID=UPI002DD9845F|nr:fluoride efflux transporter CrcB [Micromonospora sp. NBC_01796]WSA85646.1 fluoride efflux transporter CrcB [Micromonospora sp. NBC_01796]
MPEPDATPVDPDVDPRLPDEHRAARPGPWPVLAVIAVGGIIGAESRFGLQHAFPHPPGGFAWATFWINISGCLLLGVLMVLVTRVWPGRALLRPFLGVGVLGGFTTFSSYTLEVQQAVAADHLQTAVAYAIGTLVAGLLAVWIGSTVTTAAVRRLGEGR